MNRFCFNVAPRDSSDFLRHLSPFPCPRVLDRMDLGTLFDLVNTKTPVSIHCFANKLQHFPPGHFLPLQPKRAEMLDPFLGALISYSERGCVQRS